MANNRLDYISIIRILCIITVIFFHCYGMMFWDSFFPATTEKYKDLYWNVNQYFLINIAMPMFVFISGYLFKFLLGIGKYPTWGNLLYKKGLRIILPYFVFGVFFMIATNDWSTKTLFKGVYWHLWFLPMLFWCFIIGYLVHRLIKDKGILYKSVVLLVLYTGTLFPIFLPNIFGSHYISKWLFWFYGGMFINEHKQIIYAKIKQYKLYLLFVLLYLVSIIVHPAVYGDHTNNWLNTLGIFSLIISICYSLEKANIYNNNIVKRFIAFSKYSFGIYIFHNWIAVLLISSTARHLFHLDVLASKHMILFPFCFTVLTIAVSWLCSYILMKTRIGKFLIG